MKRRQFLTTSATVLPLVLGGFSAQALIKSSPVPFKAGESYSLGSEVMLHITLLKDCDEVSWAVYRDHQEEDLMFKFPLYSDPGMGHELQGKAQRSTWKSAPEFSNDICARHNGHMRVPLDAVPGAYRIVWRWNLWSDEGQFLHVVYQAERFYII